MKISTTWFLLSGILLISIFFLTPPYSALTVIFGIIPLVFLLFVLIVVWREQRKKNPSPPGE